MSSYMSICSAALVDKIYRAQKERDTAVNARLRQAKDEKEDLLAAMRRLEKEQAGYEDEFTASP